MELALVLNKLAHDLGIAFGLGGATIAYLINKRATKQPQDAQTLMPLIGTISKLIMLGLLLLIFSGIGLMLTIQWEMNTAILIVKHVLVVLILINGIYLSRLGKKLAKQELKEKDKIDKIRKRLKFLGGANLLLWYVVTVLSVAL